VKVAEEGRRRPCESCRGVVGAAGRAEKTTKTQTSIAAAEGLRFLTKARRRWLSGMGSGGRTWSWRLRSVTAAEWVGAEEREREIRGICVGKEIMTWQTLIGNMS